MPKIPRPSLDSFNDLVLKQWRNGHQRKAIRFLWYTVFRLGLLLDPGPELRCLLPAGGSKSIELNA